ncbi:hypothetical protein B0F90DRAFT_1682100 [Multifurca ochricompacta]|uniref:T6SS Phospholipase effector Tle1-like catalytic domain-containing protein n=1 Tax=Multifurca ochricompacta TaxID=376703 RepID=A0AAD4QUL2_9AGAM|nr:hypothetical protein B0F90DRAFT_1682100 [Multifurca ochricompacta]
MDGYKFLMQNYDVGDKVCLFGFSRGAYTARALAGMLHKVGLLSKDNIEQIPFAYQLYTSTKPEDITLAEGFKATFSRQVPIDFLGVWDTVASVGVIMGKSLPFVDVNTTIRVFRHALSLDEHRTKFRPNLYHRSNARQAVTKGRGIRHLFQRNKAKVVTEPTVGNIQGGEDELYEADAKEVWFVGCHADVGGGVAPDTAPHALANIPLRWMIQEIVLAECSILFDFDAFARWNLPITLGQHYPPLSVDAADKSGNGTETSPPDSDQQDAQDVVQPITDQLTKIPAWWLLEIIPTSFTYQNSENKWVTRWSFHLGRGRWVPKNPLFHKSVKTRMDDSTLKYKPRAQYTKGTETYVS